mmetsp:Transcript_1700/g.2440  ORF Transcript_1700/g.2440 Transcript_1700/m.2440 type:complete len:180 (-) Transcript_1700:296-835(-)
MRLLIALAAGTGLLFSSNVTSFTTIPIINASLRQCDNRSFSSSIMIGGSQSYRIGRSNAYSAYIPPLFAVSSSESDADPNETIGRRIIVSGDVNGGYIRTCIINEAGRFRKLIGTMSPPEDSDTAEIYVEGKRRQVEGFLRWCKKGSNKVGLSQKLTVVDVSDEVPTGLYDGFYVKTGR